MLSSTSLYSELMNVSFSSAISWCWSEVKQGNHLVLSEINGHTDNQCVGQSLTMQCDKNINSRCLLPPEYSGPEIEWEQQSGEDTKVSCFLVVRLISKVVWGLGVRRMDSRGGTVFHSFNIKPIFDGLFYTRPTEVNKVDMLLGLTAYIGWWEKHIK